MIKKSVGISLLLFVFTLLFVLGKSAVPVKHPPVMAVTLKESLSPSPTTPSSTLTMDTVSRHNSRSDCWFVINKNVYDVTSYVDNHPGGPIIATGCGKDASGLFNAVRQHARKASALLPKYYIGKIL